MPRPCVYAVWAICNSAAWDAKIVISAYWVHHHQVRGCGPCTHRLLLLPCCFIPAPGYSLRVGEQHLSLDTGVQDRTDGRVSDDRLVHDQRQKGNCKSQCISWLPTCTLLPYADCRVLVSSSPRISCPLRPSCLAMVYCTEWRTRASVCRLLLSSIR